jgi:hypothetical protein
VTEPTEDRLSLRQADAAAIHDELNFIKMQIARLPTRKDIARIVLLSRAAILTLVLAAAGTAAQAESNKEQYELQERCGKDAAEFFQRFDKGYPPAVSFTNHYNPDLNGCFVLVNRTRFESGKGVTWIEWNLWDVNENRQVDVLGFRPNPEELRIASKPRDPGTPEPPLIACIMGNFIRCGDHDEYAQRFGEVVLRYMQRSVE